MKQWNRVFLSGYLGVDPEVKISKTGNNYLQASVATHRSWLTKDETWEKRTDWHTIISWNKKMIENSQYWRKGDPVIIDGELVSYDKEENGKKYRNTAIECRDLRVLKKWKKATQSSNSSPDSASNSPSGSSLI